jgi:phospholipase/carboxylesterase
LEHNDVAPERAVIGGFSQGCVMSYALGLGSDRARPAGVMAFSGFIPTVPGWVMAPSSAQGLPVIIGHGTHDPVIGVEWGRKARAELEAARAAVTYREYPLPHAIDPSFLEEVRAWLESVLA